MPNARKRPQIRVIFARAARRARPVNHELEENLTEDDARSDALVLAIELTAGELSADEAGAALDALGKRIRNELRD